MRGLLALALATTALAGCSSADSAAPDAAEISYAAADYQFSINDIGRPDADRERDAARMPGELLAFAQIDKGEKVGDYIMGGGYVTRLLAQAVGSAGKVYAFQPEEFIGFRPEYADEQDAATAPYANVTALRAPIAAPGFSEPLDTLITVQNFHDLYIGPMPAGTAEQAVRMMFDAIKPGGTLVVVDHSAKPGSGSAAADPLHRIDRQFVIDTLTAAGFALDGESDLYVQADDPRDANVFDPAIRGKSDQFALRFRKPA